MKITIEGKGAKTLVLNTDDYPGFTGSNIIREGHVESFLDEVQAKCVEVLMTERNLARE